jgi:hypothetical protein
VLFSEKIITSFYNAIGKLDLSHLAQELPAKAHYWKEGRREKMARKKT